MQLVLAAVLCTHFDQHVGQRLLVDCRGLGGQVDQQLVVLVGRDVGADRVQVGSGVPVVGDVVGDQHKLRHCVASGKRRLVMFVFYVQAAQFMHSLSAYSLLFMSRRSAASFVSAF